jgi:hypothetical protein
VRLTREWVFTLRCHLSGFLPMDTGVQTLVRTTFSSVGTDGSPWEVPMSSPTCLDCPAEAVVASRCFTCQRAHNRALVRNHDALVADVFKYRTPPRPPGRRAIRRQAAALKALAAAASHTGDDGPNAA